ncbi:MAG TPA: DNA polymerase III subunit gamma/tau [Campylobacterales bacterium]|nr:DNA polymerase III subunit gamma/tau [Campylobacterales bacterium]
MSQVLALKYRPSTFDKLIGQETITQTLTMALDQDRLSHAYLFSGLRGSGKTSTARIFAKSLVCDKGPTSTPCEVCENCITANENRHIDIVEMDAASSRKIDDIRGLIEQTKYKPNIARFKIFIIDEVHMLTKEAFNALLKTLEEPPEYVKFILATTDPMKLPPTILSRTQHFRFKKIHAPEVVKHLSHILNLENVEYEAEALTMLTRAGNGSLRDTLTLLDQAIIFSKNFIDAKSVASMLGILDPEFIDAIFNAIFKNDRDKVLEFIKELESYESEVVIDEIISYAKERFFQRDARFSTMLSDRFFRILSESKNLLFLNADSGFGLTLLFFKMIEATKIKDIDDMIDELEGKIAIAPKPQPQNIESPKEIPVPPTTPAPPPQEPQTIEPEPEKIEPIVEAPAPVPIPEPVKQNPHAKTFQELIDKLYDRNYELGECFKNSIEFVDFEDNKLKLISCAQQACKKTLRQSSGHIKHFVQECFGFEAKISMIPCPEDKEIPISQPHANEESSSMIEDVEFQKEEQPTDSCIANQVVSSTNEIDANDILENEFVKKAQELFEPKKIIIKSKI